MRLIDADKLKEKMFTIEAWEYAPIDIHIIAVGDIDDAPTIDPVKHGKWLIMPKRAWCEFNPVTAVRYMCSECANDSSFMYPYCHSCGARMDDINV